MSSLLLVIKDLAGGWRALLFLVLLLASTVTATVFAVQRDMARADLAAHRKDVAYAVAEQQAAAQAQRERERAALADAYREFEIRRMQREEEVDRLLAAARAGAVRVRERFTCPAGGVPAAAGTPAGLADGAQRGLRADDADFLVRFAARCNTVLAERNLGRQYAQTVTEAAAP